MSCGRVTIQLTGLVRVLSGVYANESSLVLASSKDEWHYTIHVCSPMWIDGHNIGVDVTMYTYSNVSCVSKKHEFHSVADLHVYCILNGSRCYCTRLSRINGEKSTDSIKHSLTLFPSPHVANNISCPDIIRREKCSRVTWGTDGTDILTHYQQELLEIISKHIYTKQVYLAAEPLPRPLENNIQLGSIQHMKASSLSSTGNEFVTRVADMLVVCHKACAENSANAHQQASIELSYKEGTIYFPCRGGPTDAMQRLKTMLLSLRNMSKDDASNKNPLLSSPLIMCDVCSDRAIAIHTKQWGTGLILHQPIAIPLGGEHECKHQSHGPLHLFSISLKTAARLEREILCCQEERYIEVLSQHIEEALHRCLCDQQSPA